MTFFFMHQNVHQTCIKPLHKLPRILYGHRIKALGARKTFLELPPLFRYGRMLAKTKLDACALLNCLLICVLWHFLWQVVFACYLRIFAFPADSVAGFTSPVKNRRNAGGRAPRGRGRGRATPSGCYPPAGRLPAFC